MQVVVNPYKRYPIYTHRVCKIYLGKRRNEVKAKKILLQNETIPPHPVQYRNEKWSLKYQRLVGEISFRYENGLGKKKDPVHL